MAGMEYIMPAVAVTSTTFGLVNSLPANYPHKGRGRRFLHWFFCDLWNYRGGKYCTVNFDNSRKNINGISIVRALEKRRIQAEENIKIYPTYINMLEKKIIEETEKIKAVKKPGYSICINADEMKEYCNKWEEYCSNISLHDRTSESIKKKKKELEDQLSKDKKYLSHYDQTVPVDFYINGHQRTIKIPLGNWKPGTWFFELVPGICIEPLYSKPTFFGFEISANSQEAINKFLTDIDIYHDKCYYDISVSNFQNSLCEMLQEKVKNDTYTNFTFKTKKQVEQKDGFISLESVNYLLTKEPIHDDNYMYETVIDEKSNHYIRVWSNNSESKTLLEYIKKGEKEKVSEWHYEEHTPNTTTFNKIAEKCDKRVSEEKDMSYDTVTSYVKAGNETVCKIFKFPYNDSVEFDAGGAKCYAKIVNGKMKVSVKKSDSDIFASFITSCITK